VGHFGPNFWIQGDVITNISAPLDRQMISPPLYRSELSQKGNFLGNVLI